MFPHIKFHKYNSNEIMIDKFNSNEIMIDKFNSNEIMIDKFLLLFTALMISQLKMKIFGEDEEMLTFS